MGPALPSYCKSRRTRMVWKIQLWHCRHRAR